MRRPTLDLKKTETVQASTCKRRYVANYFKKKGEYWLLQYINCINELRRDPNTLRPTTGVSLLSAGATVMCPPVHVPVIVRKLGGPGDVPSRRATS